MLWLNEQCLPAAQSSNGQTHTVWQMQSGHKWKGRVTISSWLYRNRVDQRDTTHDTDFIAKQHNITNLSNNTLFLLLYACRYYRRLFFLVKNQLSWCHFLYLTLKTDRREHLRWSYPMTPCSNLSLSFSIWMAVPVKTHDQVDLPLICLKWKGEEGSEWGSDSVKERDLL